MVCGSVRDSVGGAVIEVFGIDALGMVGIWTAQGVSWMTLIDWM